jgi:hypothetical protein
MKSSFTCAAAPLQFQTISFVSSAPERGFDLIKIPIQIKTDLVSIQENTVPDGGFATWTHS